MRLSVSPQGVLPKVYGALKALPKKAKQWLTEPPPDYVPPVGSGLRRLADASDAVLLKKELEWIRNCRVQCKGNTKHIEGLLRGIEAGASASSAGGYTVGLALSGGGIRSATFCLGVLQRLADADLLRQFDYLSTVSGGGYVGCALTWWLADKTSIEGRFLKPDLHKSFPYGTNDPARPVPGSSSDKSLVDSAKLLSYLRENGNYLIPGHGITLWSGIVVVLRAILLNLLVWIPITAAIFIAIHYIDCWFMGAVLRSLGFDAAAIKTAGICADKNRVSFLSALVIAAFFGSALVIFSVGHSLLAWLGRSAESITGKESEKDPHELTQWLASGLLAVLYIAVVAYLYVVFSNAIPAVFQNVQADALAYTLRNGPWRPAVTYAVVVLIALGLIFLFALPVRAAWKKKTNSPGYSGRRAFERYFGNFFLPAIIVFSVATVPTVVAQLGDDYWDGAISVLMGAGTALWGHMRARSEEFASRTTEFVLILGSVLFVYGLFLLGYRLSLFFLTPPDFWNEPSERATLLALVLAAVFTGWFTNLNGISLHRFYRDRLMEAFMPNYETVAEGKSGPATLADEFRLSACSINGPLPIINTNVILVKSAVRKYHCRGGDNFILTPYYSGSNATGWRLTRSFMRDEITLPTAMAISGAAANPQTGPGGSGVTRNRVVSLVMLLLAFRLGYWVANPKSPPVTPIRPNHFYPAAWYSWGYAGYNENSHYLELSDGGHFENLGIYELVRRRCGVIVVCDGGQDASASYADFITAMRRVEEDFGAEIRPIKGYGPELLVPHPDKHGYPRGADYARQGYFVAEIDYHDRGGKPWPETGILIYLKSSMLRELSLKTKGYRGAHSQFPNESTADQFFDEEQFEAYREVGYVTASEMLGDLNRRGLLRGLLERRHRLGKRRINAVLRAAREGADKRRV